MNLNAYGCTTSSVVWLTKVSDPFVLFKRQRYAHYGVPEYWIVDPELDLVKIYRFTVDRYSQATILTREAQDILTTPLLPGLNVPLVMLFK